METLSFESLKVMLKDLPKKQSSCDDVDIVISVDYPQDFMDAIVDLRIKNPNKDFAVRVMPYRSNNKIIGRLQMK